MNMVICKEKHNIVKCIVCIE